MPQQQGGRRAFTRKALSTPPRPRYRSVALKPETYDKVVFWADHLREQWGRCTIGDAIDYLVDNAGVPPQDEGE